MSTDRKDRAPSPSSSSQRNVVDHDAPNGTNGVLQFQNLMNVVTDDVTRPVQKVGIIDKSHVIQVQPLKRSEMQVSSSGSVTSSILIS